MAGKSPELSPIYQIRLTSTMPDISFPQTTILDSKTSKHVQKLDINFSAHRIFFSILRMHASNNTIIAKLLFNFIGLFNLSTPWLSTFRTFIQFLYKESGPEVCQNISETPCILYELPT